MRTITLLLLAIYLFVNQSFAQTIDQLSLDQLNEKVVELYGKAQYKEAIKYAEEAVKKAAGVDSLIVETNSNLGLLYSAVGDYTAAEKAYKISCSTSAKIHGKDSEAYANKINHLALLYKKIGQFDKAAIIYQEARSIYEKNNNTQNYYYGILIDNLGNLYLSMGQMNMAEQHFLLAKKIFEEVLPPNHSSLAFSYNNLAALYQQQGKYEKAKPLLLAALPIWKKNYGATHPNYIFSLDNLGGVLRNLEEYEEAEILYEEVLQLGKQTFGEQHPSYGVSLNNLALLFESSGQLEKAEDTYRKAQAISIRTYGENHMEHAIILNNLAIVYIRMKAFEKAERVLKQSKAIRAINFGKNHPEYAQVLNLFTELYLEQELLDTAMNYCLKAFQANSKTPSSSLPEIKQLAQQEYYSLHKLDQSLQNLVAVTKAIAKQQNNFEEYYQASKTAIHINEKIRTSFNEDQGKLRILKTNSFYVENATQAAFELGAAAHLDDLLFFAEQNKSILLAEALQSEKAQRFGFLPDSLFQKEQDLQKSKTELRTALFQEKDSIQREALRTQLNSLNFKIDTFIKTIKNNYPQFHQYKYKAAQLGIKDIQQQLEKEDLFIEFLLTNSTIYLLAISAQEVKAEMLKISQEELDLKVKDLRKAISDYNFIKSEAKAAKELYGKTAYWFYQNLLAETLTAFPAAKRLILVTDGSLGHVPFGVFLQQEIEDKQPYATLPYLLNTYSISYNYSGGLWLENRQQAKASSSSGKLLGLAASYSATTTDSILTRAGQSINRSPILRNLRDALQELPAAQDEVQNLANFYRGEFLLALDASEKNFKQQAAEYSIIHLAMHGLLNQEQPLLSSLAFTENGDSVENNFLQAYEISHLKLNAELVVLSACETGYGKFQQGEGVMSLARSFMYAGVPALVVSLWQVNDQSTSLIMQNFYANLAKGMDKAKALQQAKLDYIASVDNDIAAHPAFWAPFIQLGDSRPVKLAKKGGSSWVWMVGGGVGLLGLVGLIGWRRRKRAV